jgi:hypothetical protein
MQDRNTVWAKHTKASETILDVAHEVLGDVGHRESRFGPFRDNATIRGKIDERFVLNVP